MYADKAVLQVPHRTAWVISGVSRGGWACQDLSLSQMHRCATVWCMGEAPPNVCITTLVWCEISVCIGNTITKERSLLGRFPEVAECLDTKSWECEADQVSSGVCRQGSQYSLIQFEMFHPIDRDVSACLRCGQGVITSTLGYARCAVQCIGKRLGHASIVRIAAQRAVQSASSFSSMTWKASH